jgi:hypothetical protein
MGRDRYILQILQIQSKIFFKAFLLIFFICELRKIYKKIEKCELFVLFCFKKNNVQDVQSQPMKFTNTRLHSSQESVRNKKIND